MTKKTTSKEVLETETDSADMKSCFIITPIGAVGSEIYNKTEGLIKSIIGPVLREFNFKPLPAHHINLTGSITKQIITSIYSDELVIANLTGTNPNVMYELAIRHAFGKEVIIMAEEGTKLPFDIDDQRTIFYVDSFFGSERAKNGLRAMITQVLGRGDDSVISNPVYDAIKEVAVVKSVDVKDQDLTRYMLERFDKIDRILSHNSRREKLSGLQMAARKLSNSNEEWLIKTKLKSPSVRFDDSLDQIFEKYSIMGWKLKIVKDTVFELEFRAPFRIANLITQAIHSLPNIDSAFLYSNESGGQFAIFGLDGDEIT